MSYEVRVNMDSSDDPYAPLGDHPEPYGGQPAKKKTCRRSTMLALLALLAIVFTVGAVIVSTSMKSGSSGVRGPRFGFEEIFNTSFSPRYASVQWMTSVDAYTGVVAGDIIQYSLPGEEQTKLAKAEDIVYPESGEPLNYQRYTVSGDRAYILFEVDSEPLYRHSTIAAYYVLRVSDGRIKALAGGLRMRWAEWSPTGHSLAFVYENNIYLDPMDSGLPKDTLGETTAVTSDGEWNHVINGVCDWVYEEEVFSRTSAMWWSPDSSRLAFLRFDETAVREYTFPYYDMPYNRDFYYKYPKTGERNSKVSVWVYHLAEARLQESDLGDDEDRYIVDIHWMGEVGAPSPATEVVVRVMNRMQNQWQLHAVDAAAGTSRPLSSAEHPQWLDAHHAFRYFPERNQYIDVLVHQDQNHLALFDGSSGELVHMITASGSWGVRSVLGSFRTAEGERVLYFTSDQLGGSNRTIFAVRVDQADYSEAPRLVPAVPGQESAVTWESASFSVNGRFLVFLQQGDLPMASLREVDAATGLASSELKVLQDNARLRQAFEEVAMPRRVWLPNTIPSATVPGVYLNAFLVVPPGFRLRDRCDGSARKHPVLVHAYGGPNSARATGAFAVGAGGNTGWHSYLAASEDYLVLVVDPVGTQGKGDSFAKAHTYQKLGISETRDVLGAAEWLGQQCYVDKRRIAYWGWSFGGFMAGMIATDPQQYPGGADKPGLFKAAISVAPVTDWHLYDTIWTERYMRRPQDNPEGYETTSVVKRYEAITEGPLKPARIPSFLLIHGSADDNVSIQSTALLSQAFVNHRQVFESMIYTNQDHALRMDDGSTNAHLYALMTDFLLRKNVA